VPHVAVLSLVAVPAARVIVTAICVAVMAPGRVRQWHRLAVQSLVAVPVVRVIVMAMCVAVTAPGGMRQWHR